MARDNKKITNYIRSRGLNNALVAQEMGVSRQAIEQYGKTRTPTAKVLKKLAQAMTSLGAPTKVTDLVAVLYED